MKPYLISLAVGLLVGVIYGALNVRSPAPPVIALVGLLGILLGEQAAPIAKQVLAGKTLSISWIKANCKEHVFASMPGPQETPARDAAANYSDTRKT